MIYYDDKYGYKNVLSYDECEVVNDLIRERLYQLEHSDRVTYNEIVELETILDKINGLHPRDRDEDQVLAEMKEVYMKIKDIIKILEITEGKLIQDKELELKKLPQDMYDGV